MRETIIARAATALKGDLEELPGDVINDALEDAEKVLEAVGYFELLGVVREVVARFNGDGTTTEQELRGMARRAYAKATGNV